MQASVLYFALCCAEYAIEYRVFVVVLRKRLKRKCHSLHGAVRPFYVIARLRSNRPAIFELK